jgi:hypothetical protein
MHIRPTLACLAIAWLCTTTASGDTWKYIVPKPDDAWANPPPRALALTSQKPADLKESVKYRGTRQRYAQLVYGTGRTARVTIVVDHIGDDQIDLYVDADRDGEITAKDLVQGAGMIWRAPLKAVIPAGAASREFARTVVFRYGRVSRTLSVATCGYMEGRTDLNGKMVVVRRVDGDANGLFGDAQDRIWIDYNGDGVWDSFNKEFLFAPILRIDDQRFAVRADAAGEQLRFARLEGTAKLRLRLPASLKADQVEEIQATVQSRDGVVANLRSLETATTVPAGSYRISSLLLTLKDPKSASSWGFVFNDNNGRSHAWHDAAKDAEIAIDPIGSLDFTVEMGEGQTTCRAGETMTVRPALYTGEGLLIERAYRGAFTSSPFGGGGCSGQIALHGADEAVLDSASSGFA